MWCTKAESCFHQSVNPPYLKVFSLHEKYNESKISKSWLHLTWIESKLLFHAISFHVPGLTFSLTAEPARWGCSWLPLPHLPCSAQSSVGCVSACACADPPVSASHQENIHLSRGPAPQPWAPRSTSRRHTPGTEGEGRNSSPGTAPRSSGSQASTWQALTPDGVEWHTEKMKVANAYRTKCRCVLHAFSDLRHLLAPSSQTSASLRKRSHWPTGIKAGHGRKRLLGDSHRSFSCRFCWKHSKARRGGDSRPAPPGMLSVHAVDNTHNGIFYF